MELITYQDFENLLSISESYYNGRWSYFSKVIDILKNQANLSKVLELGPSFQPIVKDCDIMIKPEIDEFGRPSIKAPKEYLHDATVIPWSIQDKEYDMFIGLQVWEHLAGKQKEVFNEVMRISKMAILSFPYMWNCPKDNEDYPEHHMIDEKIISDWTLEVTPTDVIKIPREVDSRIIYFWKF